MVVVFDADIFEEKVQGYDETRLNNRRVGYCSCYKSGFLNYFCFFHIDGSYEQYILGHETEFLTQDEKGI